MLPIKSSSSSFSVSCPTKVLFLLKSLESSLSRMFPIIVCSSFAASGYSGFSIPSLKFSAVSSILLCEIGLALDLIFNLDSDFFAMSLFFLAALSLAILYISMLLLLINAFFLPSLFSIIPLQIHTPLSFLLSVLIVIPHAAS